MGSIPALGDIVTASSLPNLSSLSDVVGLVIIEVLWLPGRPSSSREDLRCVAFTNRSRPEHSFLHIEYKAPNVRDWRRIFYPKNTITVSAPWAITDLPNRRFLAFPRIRYSLQSATSKLIILGMGGGNPRYDPSPSPCRFLRSYPFTPSRRSRVFGQVSFNGPTGEISPPPLPPAPFPPRRG